MSFQNYHQHNRHHLNHERPHHDRVESEQDYHTYVTNLEKKTSMIDAPHFGNMQHAFERTEVCQEVDQEFESSGRFGRAKHMGVHGNKGRHGHHNSYEVAETEDVECFERKHNYL